MIRLRPYKPADTRKLLEWWEDADETVFVKWSCGKFSFPLTAGELDEYFREWCLKEERGWLMTALDGDGVPVGHYLMRLADYEEGSVRIGFIVMDPKVRGKGYGKEMIGQILTYAFRILGMRKVSLGVFENKPQAKACYEAAGFAVREYIPDYLEYKGTTDAAFEMEAVYHE